MSEAVVAFYTSGASRGQTRDYMAPLLGTPMQGEKLRFYTETQLGTHQALTPEGFLLCLDVPIARVGTMYYSQGEVPVEANQQGIIRIHRDEAEVFAPIAIASFNGKPVTNDHPPEKVKPDNWKVYTIGTVINPRRGSGVLDRDFLYADLLIHDPEAIRAIRGGKREVSAGYDAEYQQVQPGEGRQHLIVGNHVALVDKGRCGPRCFVGDASMAVQRRVSVGDTILSGTRSRIMDAFTAHDASALVDELDKVSTMLGDILSGATAAGGTARANAGTDAGATQDFDAGGTHIHIHGGSGRDDIPDVGAGAGAAVEPDLGGAAAGGAPAAAGGGGMAEVLERLEALERAVAILAQQSGGGSGAEPAGTEEPPPAEELASEERPDEEERPTSDKGTQDARRRAMVGDSTSLRIPWQEVISRAEMLVPGIKDPTFDAARPAKTTFDAICTFRKKALTEALKEDDTRSILEGMNGGKPNVAGMTCDAAMLLFNGASEMIRQRSNSRAAAHTSDGINYNSLGSANAGIQATVAEINKKNRARHGIVS